ncbi:hypothetical protein C1H46_027451 [Malus baccata]|uniref:Uncharacterized protein n=1 Tax=Malus baccata TaxID=106549 RepID=A0A540LKK0_MALBA|nr:hypothetical protein C1H46_027451 [Malus baccata]
MRTKVGRKEIWDNNWKEAMPAAGAVLVRDAGNNHPDASFALHQQQASAAAQEQEHQEEPQTTQEDGDGDGDGEAEEDADDEGGGDGDGEAGAYDENRERNKLDDGFYEIEAIRRKRVRKQACDGLAMRTNVRPTGATLCSGSYYMDCPMRF